MATINDILNLEDGQIVRAKLNVLIDMYNKLIVSDNHNVLQRVDQLYIRDTTPAGNFLKDDGTWAAAIQTLAQILLASGDTGGYPFLSPDGIQKLTVNNLGVIVSSVGEDPTFKIISPFGFYYPSLGFYNNGGDLMGGITAYNTTLYIGGTGGTPLRVTGANVILPSQTISKLLRLDVGGNVVSCAFDAADVELISRKNVALGYCGLDGGGKVLASQLPSTVMELQGDWNANTNTPTLANGTGSSGDCYEVSVAGTTNFGAGAITFKVGDWVVYGASGIWHKSINSNEVTSVNAKFGTVVLVTDDIAEGVSPVNLWFTNARAIAALLTGYVKAAGTVSATDSILAAIQKLDGNNDLKADKLITHNTQTASYTLVLADKDKMVEMNVAGANNLTIPLNATIAFPIGSQILWRQEGAGQTTIVATGGVTIKSFANQLKSAGQYAGGSLIKRGTDEWELYGNLTV